MAINMTISEGISQIIEKRNAKAPALEKKLAHLQDILSQVQKINSVRDRVLSNSEKLNTPPDVKASIQSINTMDFEHNMQALIDFYSNTIERFKRPEISIAVVGAARQGKSQLLQSISNLDNSVIPAFASNDCTGASSVIKNVPGTALKADISFRDEIEMVNAVQEYLNAIFGKDTVRLDSFDGIGRLSVSELEMKIPKGSVDTTKFDHLKKYIEHFDEWKDLVHRGHIVVTDPAEIQKYVAQHNGEKELSDTRRNYCYYLAVKEAVISCEFNNPDTGRIVLRDTIGLGDTSLGIRNKMLETISRHSDAAIIVRRPEAVVGKFDELDATLYELLHNNFKERNMSKWLFWLINNSIQGSIYGDNSDRCQAFKKTLDDQKWDIAQSSIVDAADKDAVNNVFLPSVLHTLIDNIDAVDAGIMTEIQSLSEKAFSEFKKIQSTIKNIFVKGASNEIDKTDFLDNKWDKLYNSGLMKLLKGYKGELSDKKDMESVEFKNKVIEILNNSVNLVPSEETLFEQLEKGGKNRGIDAYTMRMDKLRTGFTREFLNIDEEVFDDQVAAFKTRIVEIFTSDEGGKFGHLMPLSDYDTPEEWLTAFAEKYFVKQRYEQFKVSFNMLADFSLTVRGFLMHRIRDRIDWLNPDEYPKEHPSNKDEARQLYRNMKTKLNSVIEELTRKFKDELFREPNRVFHAIISEFYDRINFSYQEDEADAEQTWKAFYRENIVEIWSGEFRENMKLNAIYKDWSEISNSFSKITKQDFSSNI